MNAERLEQLVLAAGKQRILCLGDVMLDDYIYGTVTRISPEAPVPVLSHTRTAQMPGGAANTARNLAALGTRTRLISMIGADEAGESLQDLLAGTEGIDPLFFIDQNGTTTRKTRLVSGGQQLLRLDRDAGGNPSDAVMADIVEAIIEAVEGATAILVSDYAKGFVTPDVITAVLQASLANGVPVIVDPKGTDIARYGPVDLLKPNAAELGAMVEMETRTDAQIEAALNMAVELCAAKAILVTRAGQGLSYIQHDGKVHHYKGVERAVFDVSGAGDTSLAALGIAISAGASLQDAAEFALLASGLAVEKSGTAVLTPAEILASHDNKVSSLDQMLQKVAHWRSAGRSVGFTNGCFDILHPGHLRVLEEAKARCGHLIVGVNSDASVKRLKGETRPVNTQDARARMLAGLAVVDGVVIFDEETPAEIIGALVPDLLVKGGDYTEETIVGADFVRKAGGQVHIVALLDGFSTSATIDRARS